MNTENEKFKEHYKEFWDKVKHSIDENGWVYCKDLPNIMDAYFEGNTGEEIEFQKSFGPSGENENWLTRGARWRPKSIAKILA